MKNKNSHCKITGAFLLTFLLFCVFPVLSYGLEPGENELPAVPDASVSEVAVSEAAEESGTAGTADSPAVPELSFTQEPATLNQPADDRGDSYEPDDSEGEGDPEGEPLPIPQESGEENRSEETVSESTESSLSGLSPEMSGEEPVSDEDAYPSGTVAETEPVPESGAETSSFNEVTIGPVSFQVVDNQEYSSEADSVRNCSLTFDFTNSESTFRVFLTGLQITNSDISRILQDIGDKNPDSPYLQAFDTIAAGVANSYTYEYMFNIVPENYQILEEGLNRSFFDIIDAEKYSTSEWSRGTEGEHGTPYGDAYLCWAAAASDMLTYAGYGTSASGMDEDALFTRYTEDYYDCTGDEEEAIQWYFNGVGMQDNVWDSDGNIILSGDCLSFSQATSGRTLNGGNYVSDYASEYAVQQLSAYSCDTSASALLIKNTLDSGNALGISFNIQQDGYLLSAHAVAVFGYLWDLKASGAPGLKALFLTDSDNDTVSPMDSQVITDPSTTEQDRRNARNCMTLYYATTEEHYGDDAWNLKKSYNAILDSYDRYLSSVTTLSCENTLKKSAVKETEGIRDRRTAYDIVPTNLELRNWDGELIHELYDGEDAILLIMMENRSFRAVTRPEASVSMVIQLSYQIDYYDSARNLIRSCQYQEEFERDSSALNALSNFYLEQQNFSMTEPGSYYLGVTVLGMGYTSGDGTWIPLGTEAYLTNNRLLTLCYLEIIARTRPEDLTPTTVPGSRVVPVVCSSYVLGSGPLSIRFNPDGKNLLEKGLSLRDSNGKLLSPEDYSLCRNSDGSLSITFTEEFLNTLGTGRHTLTLWSDGPVISLVITIA